MNAHNAAVLRAIASRIRILEEQRDAAQRSADRLTAMIESERAFLERMGYAGSPDPPTQITPAQKGERHETRNEDETLHTAAGC